MKKFTRKRDFGYLRIIEKRKDLKPNFTWDFVKPGGKFAFFCCSSACRLRLIVCTGLLYLSHKIILAVNFLLFVISDFSDVQSLLNIFEDVFRRSFINPGTFPCRVFPCLWRRQVLWPPWIRSALRWTHWINSALVVP